MKRLMLAVVALFTMATVTFAQDKPATTDKKAKTEKTSKKSESHKKAAKKDASKTEKKS